MNAVKEASQKPARKKPSKIQLLTYDPLDCHKWASKMEMLHFFSGKPAAHSAVKPVA